MGIEITFGENLNLTVLGGDVFFRNAKGEEVYLNGVDAPGGIVPDVENTLGALLSRVEAELKRADISEENLKGQDSTPWCGPAEVEPVAAP
jgi:hypothetical protein